MKKQLCLLLLLVVVFVFDLCVASNDTHTLTQFRLQTDVHGALVSNWSGGDACVGNWHGVNCSDDGRVTSLTLPSLFLRGPLDALSSLDHLRLLDLHDNRLNGSLSPLSNCTKLTLLYLAGNDFSGQIPPEIASLDRLVRLDISDNNVRGSVPEEISKLTRLLTLRLQNNLLSGEVPDLSSSLVHLEQLNFTNNQLYGRVPEGLLRKFGQGSFSGNEGLCGSIPLPPCSSDQTVPSNPTSFPQNPVVTAQDKKPSRKGLSRGTVVAIVVANCVAFVAIVSFIVAHYYARDRRSSDSDRGSECRSRRSEKVIGNCGGDSDGTSGTDRSKLVFFDRKKQFELEDLLRASAEMLGKGSLGTVYRAVLDDGSTVAVKRLKDANPCARKEFEQYMDLIGKLNHPNIVTFRGYYYAKEEKLLVYDYLPNRTLHSLLHGNRGPGRIPLDWTTRIVLVLGAARGLAWVHHQYSAPKVPHGNVKSSNVLLDKNGVACLSDFGLSLLLNPVHAIARMGGYKAPEQDETKRLSQNADVYSFGVLLLEVLTGRAPSQHSTGPASEDEDLPRWVRSVVMEEWTAEVFDQELMRYKGIEEELVSMLHVALACVAPQPEKRPTMARVVKMIEDIRVEQSPLVEDSGQSRNSLSPSLPTTDDGLT